MRLIKIPRAEETPPLHDDSHLESIAQAVPDNGVHNIALGQVGADEKIRVYPDQTVFIDNAGLKNTELPQPVHIRTA